MSAQAPRQVDPPTRISTKPGENYEAVGEVRVSSAADIAGCRASGSCRPAPFAGTCMGWGRQGFGASDPIGNNGYSVRNESN